MLFNYKICKNMVFVKNSLFFIVALTSGFMGAMTCEKLAQHIDAHMQKYTEEQKDLTARIQKLQAKSDTGSLSVQEALMLKDLELRKIDLQKLASNWFYAQALEANALRCDKTIYQKCLKFQLEVVLK